MRPQLKPALRRVWRDATTLQLGLDPWRAVVITGLDPDSAQLVESLDGTRDLPALEVRAAELGVAPTRLAHLVGLLQHCGVLDDGSADRTPLRRISATERERLGPDLAATSVVRTDNDGGVAVLARRQRAVVTVHGAGRIGAALVGLLAAAGVGAVHPLDEALATVSDASPAGLRLEDRGSRRSDAAGRLARAIAPSVRLEPPRGGQSPTLTVLTSLESLSPGVADELVRRGVPHLFAAVREGRGCVGPLVLPGRTSCARCHDLYRSERDPAWPRIAAQLSDGHGSRVVACDVALATAVAALSALQVLAFLDTDTLPPSADGTFEIDQSDGRVRRRSWGPHPQCGCHWSTG